MSEWQTVEGEHWATNADRYTRMLTPYGDIVASAAAWAAGERVLDVGCGNGDLSLLAGHSVGSGGSVVGVDLSPAMLGVAAERARSAGLGQVSFAEADAASFTPDPALFDVVVSRFGVMFFPDPASAFTHLRTLMRPGGRLVFVCWQDVFSNAWMVTPAAAIAEVLPLPTGGDALAPGPFAFSDAERVSSILSGAGFTDVTSRTARAPMWLGDDPHDCVDFLRTTGMGRVLFSDAAPDLVEEATRRAADALAPHQGPAGVQLDGSAWLFTATA